MIMSDTKYERALDNIMLESRYRNFLVNNVKKRKKIQILDISKLVHACEYDNTVTSHFPLKEWSNL